MQNSAGNISFTADIWSADNLDSYLAMTAHWIGRDKKTGTLSLKVALIAFHRLPSRHTGAEIAQAVLHVIDRAEIGISSVSV